MYRRARETGIRVVAGSIIPYNTATPEQNTRMQEINAWIRKQSGSDPLMRFVGHSRGRLGGRQPGFARRLA